MHTRFYPALKSFVYEAMVASLQRRRKRLNPGQVVDEVERVAKFAFLQHPGLFADGRVENALLDFNEHIAGKENSCPAINCFERRDHPRVLHVASELYRVGGHSRVLARWIHRDLTSHHCVVLTRQLGDVPPLMAATCRQHGAELINLPRDKSKVERAARLRRLAKQADRVVLHHHPDDAIPVLAFATKGGPPVAFFNHAHFWYSLGGAVADITLNTLPFFARLTERFRFPRAVATFAGMPWYSERTVIDKNQAKRDLGLDPSIPVLLTIGSEHYFGPALGYNFFSTLQKVLAAREKLLVLVIGPSPQTVFLPQNVVQDARVRFLGYVADPVPYYHAADICLESFPFPSLGAFVEAVAYGAAFPIPGYAASEDILHPDRPPLPSVSPRPKDETEYVDAIATRLADLPQTHTLACELQKKLWALDQEWPSILQGVYSRIDALSHTPGPIPAAHCSFERDHQLLASMQTFHLLGAIYKQFSCVEGMKLILKLPLHGPGPLKDTMSHEWDHLCYRIQRRLKGRQA